MKIFFYLLYNLLLLIAFILYFPVILYKIVLQGRYLKGIKERFGFLDKSTKEKFKNESTIWIHAVSDNEVFTVKPLLIKLKKEYPDYKILLSTVTDKGQQIAHSLIEYADDIICFPLDFSPIVWWVVRKIKPELILISETDFWPNFLRQAQKSGAKVMLFNGRISANSAENYNYLGPLMTEMIQNIDLFTMRSPKDLEHMLALGANRAKVKYLGDIRFDFNLEKYQDELTTKDLTAKSPVLTAGNISLKTAGRLCYNYIKLQQRFSDLTMFVIPRSWQQIDEIVTYYRQLGVKTVVMDEFSEDYSRGQVFIITENIELASIYKEGDLIISGGSLSPEGVVDNSLFPLLTPVIFGPHLDSVFKNRKFIFQYEFGIKISDAQSLKQNISYYFKDMNKISVLKESMVEAINKNRAIIDKNLNLINSLLKGDDYDGS